MQTFDSDEKNEVPQEEAPEAPDVPKAPEIPWLPPKAPVRPNVKEPDASCSALHAFVTPGTPECGLLCGLAGVAIAALLLWIGFWKTVFVVVLGAVGVFLGAVENKSEWVKALINRLFPPKN